MEKTNYMIVAPPKASSKNTKRFGSTDLKVGKNTIKAQKRLKYLGVTSQKNVVQEVNT